MKRRLTTAGVLALLALALSAAQGAASISPAPHTGTVADAARFTVNDGPGDQTDPHVRGGLVTYTSQVNGGAEIRVHDLGTGSDAAIPSDGGMDFLSDVSGGKVTYTHLTTTSSIRLYDPATGTTTDLGGSNRRESRIGGNTIAWQDFDYTGDTRTPEIAVEDTASGSITRLTDDALLDKDPAVSPDGNVVVWTKCQTDGTGCTIWEARKGAGGWTADALTSAGEGEAALADTDGRVVVYSVVAGGDEDVRWQAVGGGPEHDLALDGQQTNPNVSNGVITFEQLDVTTQVPNFDLWAYDVATNTLYRLTDAPQDETLNDIWVSPDRHATVVWTEADADYNVDGETFSLPPLPATLALSPSGGTQAAGTDGTVTATVADASGGPVPDTVVRFAVSGAASGAGSCTTDAAGACSFTYDGPAAPGTVDIAAFADTDGDGVAGDGEPSATATRTFAGDTTPPTVSVGGFTDGQLVLLGAPRPTPTCSSSDAGSGIASTTGPTEHDDLTANGVGTVSVTCTATDGAGNTAAATSSYRIVYAVSGFLAPVEVSPAVNAGHPGRTYPLKWQLTDANGAAVGALSAAASISYRAVSCDTFGGDSNPVDATTTGDSGLRYDAAANQYVYTWSTPRTSGCYVLSVALDSGQQLQASFRLS